MSELLLVPVRVCGGAVVLRIGRLDHGRGRTGIAFTDEARLRAVFGDDQRWITLAEPALRAMLRPMGIVHVQVDPLFVAPRAPVRRPSPPLARSAS